MVEYETNAYYQHIAESVIKAMPELWNIENFGVRICYLASNQKKSSGGKMVHADCEKVKDKYKSLVPFDFIITVYEPNVAHMTENQLKILLWHELKHVGVEAGDEAPRFSIIPHDFEDFNDIVTRFGNWWSEPGAEPDDILENAEASNP